MESRAVLLKYLSFSLISNSPFLTLSPQMSSCHPPILPLRLPAAPAHFHLLPLTNSRAPNLHPPLEATPVACTLSLCLSPDSPMI